ncbi:MAG: glycosyltransferase family 2 protein [Leptolyngbyaceae cyanobacterium]
MPANYSDISVVITCYREGELLREAVNSVRQQTKQPDEIVVVNDASPDKATNRVCRQLEKEDDVRVIWQAQNGGPSIARNAGFAAAQGEILVPLDADDLLPSQALAHIYQAFSEHPDAGFIYGDYVRQNQPGKNEVVRAKPISLATMLRSRRFSLSTNWTLIGTAPLKKWLWETVGHSDPTLGAEDLHDLEFWIRAMNLPCKFYPLPEVIYIWRKYLGSNSRRITPMSWHRIAEKHYITYQKAGLEYRANELLLLGSKWLGNADQIKKYSRELKNSLRYGEFQFSTWMILLIPAKLVRPLTNWISHRR